MTEEIKEILEDIKRHLDYVEVTKQSSIRDNEMKAMYNYITNLQEENEKLKETLQTDKLMKAFMVEHNRNEKAVEYIKRLDKDYDINVYQEDKHWAYVLYILEGGDE